MSSKKTISSNLLVTISVILITISIFGIISSFPKKNESAYHLNFQSENITKSFPFVKIGSASANFLDVLSSSTSSKQATTPTPTPQTIFKHSKHGFTFNPPPNSIFFETTQNEIKLIANSIGGVFLEIPESLQIEIAIVDLQGLNIFQYYHNRLATIFDDKIVSFKDASSSAILKGYEINLKNEETKQNKTLLFLGFRGNQIFEIEVVYFKPNHKKEEKIIKTLIQSLKPY